MHPHMATVSNPQSSQRKRAGLTITEESILRAFGDLQVSCLTATDMTRLRFQKSSKPFVRSAMTGLAGGRDQNSTSYLYRFRLPQAPGNSERIFSLTRRGRNFVRALGLQTHFWSPPQKAVNYTFTFWEHQLALTKSLVALHRFVRDTPAYEILETHTGASLSVNPPSFIQEVDYQALSISVLPDAWVCLEHASGEHTALWIEIDTGTEAKAKFQYLVLQRINLIRSGQYKIYFDTDSVIFAYLVIGSELYRRARLNMICRYTQELLEAENLADWGPGFRFATIEESLYDSHSLFTDALWHVPDSDTPLPLLS
jgi:hypothetical protein